MKRVWEGVRRYGKTLHSVGLSFGLVFFVLSMSPSLLPRAWYLQAWQPVFPSPPGTASV